MALHLLHGPARHRRKQQRRFESRFVVFKTQLRVVQARDGSDETQPKTGAGRMTTHFQANEPFQHAGAILEGYAGTAVGNGEGGSLRSAFDRDPNASARGRVFDRVVDEICEGLADETLVSEDPG